MMTVVVKGFILHGYIECIEAPIGLWSENGIMFAMCWDYPTIEELVLYSKYFGVGLSCYAMFEDSKIVPDEAEKRRIIDSNKLDDWDLSFLD